MHEGAHRYKRFGGSFGPRLFSLLLSADLHGISVIGPLAANRVRYMGMATHVQQLEAHVAQAMRQLLELII
jgi:hypothetical protein